jgi:hypothetical protein
MIIARNKPSRLAHRARPTRQRSRGRTRGSHVDVIEQADLCPECRHAWVNDEPAHYTDCRFFLLENWSNEDEDDDVFTLQGSSMMNEAYQQYEIHFPNVA